jgi:hypothetical protein
MIAARGSLSPALAAAIRLIGAVPETLCPFTRGGAINLFGGRNV